MMSVPTPPVARPWRTIAAEITQEQDSRKVMDLVRELEQAFDEQEVGHPKSVASEIRPTWRA